MPHRLFQRNVTFKEICLCFCGYPRANDEEYCPTNSCQYAGGKHTEATVHNTPGKDYAK